MGKCGHQSARGRAKRAGERIVSLQNNRLQAMKPKGVAGRRRGEPPLPPYAGSARAQHTAVTDRRHGPPECSITAMGARSDRA